MPLASVVPCRDPPCLSARPCPSSPSSRTCRPSSVLSARPLWACLVPVPSFRPISTHSELALTNHLVPCMSISRVPSPRTRSSAARSGEGADDAYYNCTPSGTLSATCSTCNSPCAPLLPLPAVPYLCWLLVRRPVSAAPSVPADAPRPVALRPQPPWTRASTSPLPVPVATALGSLPPGPS